MAVPAIEFSPHAACQRALTRATPGSELVRDLNDAPHKLVLIAEVTLNSTQAGVGSRATVQQALFVPVHASGSLFNPSAWPLGIDAMRVQRIANSWKNAGY
jgi:hypothetical protein